MHFSIARVSFSLCEKCPNKEFFLVRIFPYSNGIREKTPYFDNSHAVLTLKSKRCIQNKVKPSKTELFAKNSILDVWQHTEQTSERI